MQVISLGRSANKGPSLHCTSTTKRLYLRPHLMIDSMSRPVIWFFAHDWKRRVIISYEGVNLGLQTAWITEALRSYLFQANRILA